MITTEIKIAHLELQEARMALASAEANYIRLCDEWQEFLYKQQETGEQQ
jgi:hypothetical protein